MAKTTKQFTLTTIFIATIAAAIGFAIGKWAGLPFPAAVALVIFCVVATLSHLRYWGREWSLQIYNRAIEHVRTENSDEAIQCLDRAIFWNSQFAQAYGQRGIVFMSKGQYELAFKDLSRSNQLEADQEMVLLHLGAACNALGRFEEAIDHFSRAIHFNPHWWEAYHHRAVALYKLGATKSAIEDLNIVLEHEPKNAQAYLLRGSISLDLGDYDRVVSDLTRAIDLSPECPGVHSTRGLAHHYSGNLDFALTDHRKEIQLHPDDPIAHNNCGFTQHALHRYDEAIEEYEEAIRLDPEHPNAHKNLAWLLATCADSDFRDGKRAVTSAQTAINLVEEQQPNWFPILAAAYAEIGNFPEAIRWQQRAINECEEKPDVWDDQLRDYQQNAPWRTEGPFISTL